MERIIIISNIIFRIIDISHNFSGMIFPLPFTKGDDKRSLFNILGKCRTTQESLNNFEYVVPLLPPSLMFLNCNKKLSDHCFAFACQS